MRTYDGYKTKLGRKVAFEIEASSKQDAYNEMKRQYPDWRVHIVGSHTGRVHKIRRGR